MIQKQANLYSIWEDKDILLTVNGQEAKPEQFTDIRECTKTLKMKNTCPLQKKCADNFIKQCCGKTPAWDFCAPKEDEFTPDTSAGACAASGIITMSKYIKNSKTYMEAAKSILIDM